MQLIDDAKSF